MLVINPRERKHKQLQYCIISEQRKYFKNNDPSKYQPGPELIRHRTLLYIQFRREYLFKKVFIHSNRAINYGVTLSTWGGGIRHETVS